MAKVSLSALIPLRSDIAKSISELEFERNANAFGILQAQKYIDFED
ncbi:hypothetical protein [Brevibacillus daliensis]|nr:hypothetical protein [Brevibacillus daliensis]